MKIKLTFTAPITLYHDEIIDSDEYTIDEIADLVNDTEDFTNIMYEEYKNKLWEEIRKNIKFINMEEVK